MCCLSELLCDILPGDDAPLFQFTQGNMTGILYILHTSVIAYTLFLFYLIPFIAFSFVYI